MRWRVFFAAQVQQWLTVPLSPRPPPPLHPPQPMMSHQCLQSPLIRAAIPPWPLKQMAVWTAIPLWVHWPAADNAHLHKNIKPSSSLRVMGGVLCQQNFMLVCRSALLMYSLFLFSLPHTAVNDCSLKLSDYYCIFAATNQIQVGFGGNLWCMLWKTGVWVYFTHFCF